MTPQLSETLKEHRRRQIKKALASGKGETSEWVFTDKDGEQIVTNHWRAQVFKRALEKGKLRKVRIHDLRHTYATLRISKGDNITDVSKQLGHHSVKLTLGVYTHWTPGGKKSEVDAVDSPILTHLVGPYAHPEHVERKSGGF
jgi:integrase